MTSWSTYDKQSRREHRPSHISRNGQPPAIDNIAVSQGHPDANTIMSDSKTAVILQEEVSKDVEASSIPDTSHVAGDALLVTADGQVRKLPIPSNDPNDPLNFTKWEKLAIVVACCWFCM